MTSIVRGIRPGPARLAAFVALLATVSWGLGALAAWPWTVNPPGAAVLRVSLRHVTRFVEGSRYEPAEIEKLPRHMRPLDGTRPTTGRRADATLAVVIDGQTVFSRAYRPTGLRRDGPVYAYEEIPLAAGRRVIGVVLAEQGGAQGPRQWVLTRGIEIVPGQAPLVEFSDAAQWRLG